MPSHLSARAEPRPAASSTWAHLPRPSAQGGLSEGSAAGQAPHHEQSGGRVARANGQPAPLTTGPVRGTRRVKTQTSLTWAARRPPGQVPGDAAPQGAAPSRAGPSGADFEDVPEKGSCRWTQSPWLVAGSCWEEAHAWRALSAPRPGHRADAQPSQGLELPPFPAASCLPLGSPLSSSPSWPATSSATAHLNNACACRWLTGVPRGQWGTAACGMQPRCPGWPVLTWLFVACAQPPPGLINTDSQSNTGPPSC